MTTDITKIGAALEPGTKSGITKIGPAMEPGVRSNITKIGKPLTELQRKALDRLHQATTQLEGVFVQMVMREMSKSVPKDSIFGKESSAEQTFSGMLDDERAKAIAKSGSLGIANVLDAQLRASVLADASHEAHVDVNREIDR